MTPIINTENAIRNSIEKHNPWEVNYSLAALRAIPTAVIAGVITNPIKIWQFKKTINEPESFRHILKTGPMRAAPYGMGIHLLGSMAIFNFVPLAKKYLHQEDNMSSGMRHMLAFGIAGVFEALIVSCPNIYMQKIYASSLAEKPKAVFKKLQPQEIQKSWRASIPFYVLGAAVFYASWGSLVRQSEKELLVEEQQATVSKGIEEFMIGGIAAIFSSTLSYAINSFGNRRAHNPQLTLVQDFHYAWDKFGAKQTYAGASMIFKHYYRGFSVNLLRVPLAMGTFNLGKFFGDEMYKQCGLFSTKHKKQLSCVDNEDDLAFLRRITPS